jgi:hypothetical protein
MKKEYMNPELKIVYLDNEDICTTSADALAEGEVENVTRWWLDVVS